MRIEAIQADHYRVPLPVALSDWKAFERVRET